MVIVPGDTSLHARTVCAETTRKEVHVCNADYGAVGWAGLTELTESGPHIVSIRVRINDHYVTSATERLVACHELGHSIGLGHRMQSTSCMKQGTSTPHPDSSDYAELDLIYKHLDGATPATADNTKRTIKIYDWATPQ